MKPSSRIKVGFTLMELVLVIAVIAILAALLLPALSMAKAYARSATCKSNLHQTGVALQMYVQEHANRYPYYLGPPGPAYGDATGQGGEATGLVYWSSKLFPYCSQAWTNTLYRCPGYKGATTGPYYPGSIERLGSYAYNFAGVAKTGGFGVGPVMFWRHALAVSEAQIKAPSELLAIGESRFLAANVNGPGGFDTLRCGALGATLFAFDPARHGSKYNQLFCDGHVRAMRPEVLFNPTNTAALWNYDHQAHPELWLP